MHAIKRACWVIVNRDALSLMNETELRILHSTGAGTVSSINPIFFYSFFPHTVSIVLLLIMLSLFASFTIIAESKTFVSISFTASKHAVEYRFSAIGSGDLILQLQHTNLILDLPPISSFQCHHSITISPVTIRKCPVFRENSPPNLIRTFINSSHHIPQIH